ncbi:MAG TPA: ABC transporter permease, partial [Acidimicrobiia bacterium]|nr:ABC transporter permease [Acidimicrobiia bacterium]
GFDAVIPAYSALFRGAFVGWNSISETLLAATPLILAGLAVAVGFQAGLFNIGAEGQMTIGGLTAVIVGFSFEGLPMLIHLPLAVFAGFLGGALWGFIPGVLRAKTGAHEVITTIMLNFIAYRTMDYMLKLPFIQKEGRFDPVSEDVLPSAIWPRILSWLPFDDAPRFRLHLGFIFALFVAWLIYWLLYRSTIGFEFRAVGANPSAAKYGGIGVATAIIAVMTLAGGLAGLAGANETLGVVGRAVPGFTAQIGFDAIALALLGRSHPGGVVLSAILFGALRAGGRAMQAQSDVGIDLIVVIQALIIVFIAAPELIRAIYGVKGGKKQGQVTRGWST